MFVSLKRNGCTLSSGFGVAGASQNAADVSLWLRGMKAEPRRQKQKAAHMLWGLLRGKRRRWVPLGNYPGGSFKADEPSATSRSSHCHPTAAMPRDCVI